MRAAGAGPGGAGLAGGGAAPGGKPASALSPLTESVRIRRGSLLGSVPFAVVGAAVLGETLAAVGGLAFWFSGGKTTRGPERALTSMGASSRGTSFSPPSPTAMRSGILGALSAAAGTTLVGLLSALMIGGSPLRGEPTKLR